MNNKPRILYHGSPYEIKDGIIRAKPAYRGGKKRIPVTAVFALSDDVHAKLYAVMRLLADGKMAPKERNTVYIERLQPNIFGKKVYLYELDSDGFIEDSDKGSYYCLEDKPIRKVTEIDVMREITSNTNDAIKVYVLKKQIDFSKMSKQDADDLWEKLLENKDNFELYIPNKNINMSILAQTVKGSGLNK